MNPLPPPAGYERHSRILLGLVMLPAVAVALLAVLGWWVAGLSVFVVVFLLITYGTILPRVRLYGPLVSELPAHQAQANEVCLTIDDGPDPEVTPRLLEVLDRHQAPAIFFLIGAKARQHPDLVREIARRGHLIGNHSETHPSAHFWRLRPAAMWREIAGCQHTLSEILKEPPVWFRPPVGHHNVFTAMPVRVLGLTMLVWNCRGFDGVYRNVPGILRRLARGLRPGAVVLLHDATPIAADVLEGTLELIRSRGLRPALPEKARL